MFSEIMKFMKDNKEATASQISSALGIERESVDTVLLQLHHMGRISKMMQNATCYGKGCRMCSCSGKKPAEVYIYPCVYQQKQKTV